MDPLDFVALLWYYLYIAHDFIGNLIMTVLATLFAIFIMWFLLKVVWGLVKMICKPIVLVIGAIAAVFLLV